MEKKQLNERATLKLRTKTLHQYFRSFFLHSEGEKFAPCFIPCRLSWEEQCPHNFCCQLTSPVQPFFPGSSEQLFIPLARDAVATKPLSFPLANPAPRQRADSPRVSPQAPCPPPQDLFHLDPYSVDPPVPIFCSCSANTKKKPKTYTLLNQTLSGSRAHQTKGTGLRCLGLWSPESLIN